MMIAVPFEGIDFDSIPVQLDSDAEGTETSQTSKRRRTQRRSAPPGPSGQSLARANQVAHPSAGSTSIKIDDDLEMIVSDLRPPGTRARARTSRGIPQRALRPDLPAVYLEAFRGEFNSNILRSEYCSSCNQIFSAGDLRVGFMMEPIFRAQWLHIACIRRARLQSVGRLLCYDPSVTLADRETALKELGRSGRNSRDIQPWNYLRAFVHQWNTEVVHQTISNDDPTIEHLERDIAEILNSLPCSQLQTSQDICAICHQIMAEGEMVCNLPCGHFYHVGCIDAWLRIRTTCPLDNRQIFEKAKM